MPKDQNQLIIGLIALSFLILLIVGSLFVFLFFYRRKQSKNRAEKIMMQENFDIELSKTALEVKEETLQTVAADLHDNIGQLLSLTHANLQSINLADAEKSEPRLQAAIGLVGQSIKDLRALAKLLQADALLDIGLVAAIEQAITWLEKSGRFQINWHYTPALEKMHHPQKDLLVFRIVQEAISNTVKHAAATQIEIGLQYANNHLALTISDNGQGFPGANNKGLGLQNMKKRAGLLGATLHIDSIGGQGTTIHLSVPYEKTI